MGDLLEGTPIGEALKSRGGTESPTQQLFQLMYSDDCIKDPDCDPLLCLECEGVLETIFASSPLKVKCKNCEKEYVLRDLVKSI